MRPAWAGPRPSAAELRRNQIRMWLSGLAGSRYDGLYHFAVVAPGVLMRSGQPRMRELELIREKEGLRTIVCARGGTRHPLRGRWFRLEKGFCARHGVRLAHFSFSDHSTPPADVFDNFIRIVAEPANHPVLVHCEQGIHRTGILSAAFRIAVQGWAVERAWDEMAQFGFDVAKPRSRPLADALRKWAEGIKDRSQSA